MQTSPAAIALAHKLVATLPREAPGLFNPWAGTCDQDLGNNGPEDKLGRLAAHLDCTPRFILCGEAPGYQGCRHSGVAFTSERLLLQGCIPRMPVHPAGTRLTSRKLPFSEPSATIVWKALYDLALESDTILWNALQMHPHRPGETHSNRTPTDKELALGEPALRLLVAAFPGARLVAVGRKAEQLLADMGVPAVAQVRHPANGGATAFASGMAALKRA